MSLTIQSQSLIKYHSGAENKSKNMPEKEPTNKEPPNPLFTHRERATIKQRIEILNWHHANGKCQTKTARHFNPIYPNLVLKQPLLSKWLKEESKWRAQWEDTKDVDHDTKRVRQTQHPEVTEMMDLWVAMALEDGVNLTGEVLRQKWTRFADLRGIPEDERLHLSDGWLAKFKTRHNLKNRKRHGEAASSNPEAVKQDQQRLQNLIAQHGYWLCDIFNMDETGLFYAYVPFCIMISLLTFHIVFLRIGDYQIRDNQESRVTKSN